MQNLLSSLEPRDTKTELVHVVVDTTRGSRNKLKYDAALDCFKPSRILPVGHVLPYDFGSVPGTRAADGDALDVLVLIDDPTFPGCVVTVRLIGVLAARQTQDEHTLPNDRLIGAPETPANGSSFHHLEELGDACLDEIEHFFVAYNQAQGRTFEPTKNTGNSLDFGSSVEFPARIRRRFRPLTRGFPADCNTEFFEAEQGINFSQNRE